MANLNELYQEVIIDHSRNPRNHYELANSNCKAEGYNPLCGDQLTLFLQMQNDVIVDAAFIGCGCAISTASASLMIESVKGKSREQAETLFAGFHAMLTKEAGCSNLGKLQVLEGVREFPMRVKCATLAWHTLHAALQNKTDLVVTTEMKEGS